MEIQNTTQQTIHLPEEIIEFPKKSSKNYRKTEAPPHLPEEIIEEILSRLRVKSLLRFRCVSKSWRCLIGSDRFIRSQLKTSRENRSCYNIILNCNSENPVPGLNRCSLISFEDDPSVEPSPFDDPINDHLVTDSFVGGHCDGLLCIVKKPGCLFLWNPSTRISIELPKLDGHIRKLGFGWDELSGAYKVFVVFLNKDEDEWIGKVYSSKTNSWKTALDHGSLNYYCAEGEFVSGRIHWPMRSGYIETFDLKSEVFGMIELPQIPEVGGFLYMEVHSDRLTLVSESENNGTSTAWEMKKYGVKESWEKLCSGLLRSDNQPLFLVGVVDKGVAKLSPRENIVGCDETHCYIESLVSPIPNKNL